MLESTTGWDAKFPPLVTSPLEDWMVFLDSLEYDLVCPQGNQISGDLGVLSCGCLGSERRIQKKQQSKDGGVISCAVCGKDTTFLSPVDPLRKIHDKIELQRKQLEQRLLSGSGVGISGDLNNSRHASSHTSTAGFPEASSSSSNIITPGGSNNNNKSCISNLDFSLITNQPIESVATTNSSASTMTTNTPTDEEIIDDNDNNNNTPTGLIQIFKTAAHTLKSSAREEEYPVRKASPSDSSQQQELHSEYQRQLPKSSSSSSQDHITTASTSNSGGSSSQNYLNYPLTNVVDPTPSSIQLKSGTPSISSEENAATSNTAGSINSLTMNSPPPLPNQFSPEFMRREQHYEKCFPLYRKQFQHSTQSRSILSRSKKSSFAASISPDATKFAIVNSQKCQIYQIPWDYNKPPSLLAEPPVKDWGENPMLSMSNNYLAIANAFGSLWLYDFNSNLIYHHVSKFIINCMALSPLDTAIACGILTKNPQSNLKQPVIVLHLLSEVVANSNNDDENDNNNNNSGLISILIPYCDTLSYIKFSSDDAFLNCSTSAQCRFMVISIVNPKKPRLVMKSSRKSDPDEEFEGITSVNFVPYSNQRQYMVVTSTVSTNSAPPIIIDTKVLSSSTSSVTSSVSQPTLLMRVDKVGSKIHSSAASPRGDAIAFLDKSGLVYVMHAPGLLPDHRKICVAAEVAKAPKSSSSAAIQFSPSGRVLIVVDRKGDVHIEDYGAGTPQQAGIGKCRILN